MFRDLLISLYRAIIKKPTSPHIIFFAHVASVTGLCGLTACHLQEADTGMTTEKLMHRCEIRLLFGGTDTAWNAT